MIKANKFSKSDINISPGRTKPNKNKLMSSKEIELEFLAIDLILKFEKSVPFIVEDKDKRRVAFVDR